MDEQRDKDKINNQTNYYPRSEFNITFSIEVIEHCLCGIRLIQSVNKVFFEEYQKFRLKNDFVLNSPNPQ